MVLPGMFHLVWLQNSKMAKGLIKGYEPNRISFYITLLVSGREDDLLEVLYKDMQEYKINPNNNKGENNGD